ncbi:hypothetical protein SteCoe_34480 [Stentor coeruleus]|uniref:PA14 domain-containing protein n=1 Tax=Stentor coeruleus TaxID=5963 RepID=A0A1R2AUG7_9CILI|nr:hypothetical protein SteCoe_34480 [Stentor coeruleus]
MFISFIVLAFDFMLFASGVFLDFKITSDTSCWIVGPTSTGGYAILHDTISAWKTDFLDAKWIWDINLNTVSGFGVVTKHFYIAGVVNSGTLRIGADNRFTVYLNDVDANSGTLRIGADNRFTVYLNDVDANCKSTSDTTYTLVDGVLFDVKLYLRSGINVLKISVENTGGYAGE